VAQPRRRVAVLVAQLPPETGHLTALGRSLDLVVYASPGPGSDERQGPVEGATVRTLRALGAETAVRWLYPGLGRALRRDDPEVLHVVAEPWSLLAVQAALHARLRPRTRLVVHGCDRLWFHGGAAEQRAKRLLAGWTLRRADAFCNETDAAFALARASGLRADAPLAVVHTQPRSAELFRPPASEQERRAARRRLGLPEQGVGVGFLGRLEDYKGPQLLVQAWARLPADVRERAWCAVAGEGPLLEELQREGERAGVRVLGPVGFPDGVLDLCRAVQVLAVPSYAEGEIEDQSPRAVIEGLLAGTLVVGSRSGGIPGMLDGTGVLVEERDVDDLARGVREAVEAVSDPDGAEQVQARSVARGRSVYATDAVAERLLELWLGLLSRR
jgi:glycosyltransferase involved in cell wall biosynthesis